MYTYNNVTTFNEKGGHRFEKKEQSRVFDRI